MEDLDRLIRSKLDNYLRVFKELIKHRSVAADPKNEIKETVSYLTNILEDRGYTIQKFEAGGNPVVYAEKGGGNKSIIFYNHYDVQPPEPLEEWHTDPFDLTIKNGYIYGRGVADNKGNIVARLMAIDIFTELHGEPIKIKWMLEGEEEIGSPTLENIVDKHGSKFKADGGIWETGYIRPDNRLGFPLGYKGMVYLEIVIKKLATDTHSGYAPILPNPALFAADLISKLKKPSGEILFKQLYAGIDPEYLSIAREIMKTIPYAEINKIKEILGIDEFVGGIDAEEAYWRIVSEPSLNIAGLYSGYAGEGSKTIVPSHARIKIDIRPLPGQNPKKIYENFIQYIEKLGYKKDVDIKIHSMYPSGYTKPDEEIVKAAVEASKKAYGIEAVVTPISGGSGPIYLFTNKLGIPMAGAGVGYYASRAHAPNENIRLNDFINGVKHVYYILKHIAGIKD